MQVFDGETEQPVRYVLPPDATAEDMGQPDYVRPLADAAAPLVEHLGELLAEIGKPGFDASTRLDAVLNGADVNIYAFFEVLGGYAQGRVPYHAADELVALTNELLAKERELYPGCAAEIKAMVQAFAGSHKFWRVRGKGPFPPRRVFLSQLFASRDEIVESIKAFARALVVPSRPKMRTRARPAPDPAATFKTDRRRTVAAVVAEINRRHSRPGNAKSRRQIIREMRLDSAYVTRMTILKPATWERYAKRACPR